MSFIDTLNNAKIGQQAKERQGLSDVFKQGLVTGQESLANELVARENQRRANDVATRQQDALLYSIQDRLINGGQVLPEELVLFDQATQGSAGVPSVGPNGEPMYDKLPIGNR